MAQVNARRREIYDAVAKSQKKNGVSPSATEMAELLDLHFVDVCDTIAAMVRDGQLTYGPGGTTRHLIAVRAPE